MREAQPTSGGKSMICRAYPAKPKALMGDIAKAGSDSDRDKLSPKVTDEVSTEANLHFFCQKTELLDSVMQISA